MKYSHNRYGVGISNHKSSQSVGLSRAITDSLVPTMISVIIIVDHVSSGIAGLSPGHSDTSEAILDCCHITGR